MRYIFFSLFLFVFFSCTSNNESIIDDEVVENVPIFTNKNLIKSVFKNGTIFYEQQYDKNEKLKLRNYYSDNGRLNVKDSVTYSGDLVLIHSYQNGNELSSIRKYYKTDDNKYKWEITYTGTDLQYSTYEFYDSSCGWVEIEEFGFNGQYTGKTTYEYLDLNCSYILRQISLSGEVSREIKFIKDGKNNYRKYAFLDLFLGRSNNVGNILNMEVIKNAPAFSFQKSYTSEFEYNSDDFPVYEKRIYLDNTFDEFIYEYY